MCGVKMPSLRGYTIKRINVLFPFLGDGTCEGVVCDYNADCVTLTSGVDSVKECRCKAGFTGKGEICTGE